MHNDKEPDQPDRNEACLQLIHNSRSLLLSTVSTGGLPDISYAPYVRDEHGVFYIYVSELASHTQNMLQIGRAAILFIQPESEAANLFARERLTLHCRVSAIEKGTPEYALQLERLRRRQGEVVNVLSQLADFHLLALQPDAGRYVVGFGKAYDVAMDDFTLKQVPPGKR